MKRKRNVIKAYKLMKVTNLKAIYRYIEYDKRDGHESVAILIKERNDLRKSVLAIETGNFSPIVSTALPIFKNILSAIGPSREYI